MLVDPLHPVHLDTILKDLRGWLPIAEKDSHIDYVHGFMSRLSSGKYRSDLAQFETFLPPRLVSAAKKGNVAPFFGAGVSAGAGIPTWGDLLQQLGIPSDLASDPNLDNDPLTSAELIAHEIGNDRLQQDLRRLVRRIHTPTLIHYLLARLAQPLYITTNYDNLFEEAWFKIHENRPIVIKNDADFAKEGVDPKTLLPIDDRPILLKIHGSAEEEREELVLTRTQYRRHYRSNELLFDALKSVLGAKHTLFLGFSHRDFEISRQVEDTIYRYEARVREEGKDTVEPPAFYSLQFDLKGRTPEVFAARGIVALQQPLAIDAPKDFDFRSAGLSKALIDLLGAMDSEAHEQLDIGAFLGRCVKEISEALKSALVRIGKTAEGLQAGVGDVDESLGKLQTELGPLAGQGVYLLSHTGDITHCALPASLKDPKRKEKAKLHDRFYVQQARTYRKPFVSDSDTSIFNGQSTFFLCYPLGGASRFTGLLFSAAQCGAWDLPERLAKEFLETQQHASSFILVDSNGLVLIPPNGEFEAKGPQKLPAGEDPSANVGYPFEGLKRISRRDALITRVWKNIVPLAQDDDVMWFPPDLNQYAVVSEVPPAKWKLALVSQFPAKPRESR